MEDRIKKLEKISERLIRRSQKVAKAIIMPSPISGGVSNVVGGEIAFEFMSPCKGTISNAVVKICSKPEGNPFAEILIIKGINTQKQIISIDKELVIFPMSVDVDAGDLVSALIVASVEHPINQAWVSMLWTPTVSDAKVKQFLIDELERNEE